MLDIGTVYIQSGGNVHVQSTKYVAIYLGNIISQNKSNTYEGTKNKILFISKNNSIIHLYKYM